MRRWVKSVLATLATACCAVLLAPTSALAQSPSPAAGTNVFGNMPGVVYILIPLAIAGAVYLSRELGKRVDDDADGPERRQGAVSRTLARQKETD